MGVTDAILEKVSDLGKEVARLYKELTTQTVKVEGLEQSIDRLRSDQHRFIDRTEDDLREFRRDFDEMSRRLSKLEGLTDAFVMQSMKEAILQLGREHVEEHGTIEGFNPGGALSKQERRQLEAEAGADEDADE